MFLDRRGYFLKKKKKKIAYIFIWFIYFFYICRVVEIPEKRKRHDDSTRHDRVRLPSRGSSLLLAYILRLSVYIVYTRILLVS